MGKIKQGILGGFSGKVGPVIGSSWKGKAVMKGRALSFNDADSEAQRRQRQKFQIMVHWIFACTSFIRRGFHGSANGMTEVNACVSYNIQNAVSGTYPNQTVDFSKTKVAAGSLEGVMDPAKTYDDYTITFTWTDNSGLGNADRYDNIYACVYNKTKNQSIYKMLSARSSRTGIIDIPALWQSDSVECWMFAQHGEGMTSESVYIGTQVIS